MDFSDALKKYLLLHGFYHFTDVKNLPSVLANKGLFSRRELLRRGLKIEAPGGNKWSMDADDHFGMDAYVHLCFRPSHPMEHLAKEDGRIGQSRFLRISSEVLKIPGTMCTLDVSNKSGVTPVPIEEACKSIDWEVLYHRTDWSDAQVQVRLQQVEKYEILVPTKVPIELMSGY